MGENLRCDADGCSHIEDVDRITADHIGRPCPVCGANLLTADDWGAWKPIQALLIAADQKGVDGDNLVSVAVHLHGADITVKITKPKDTPHD